MPKVQIRAARAADKVDILAICAGVWEEAEDYVPEVWDDWLADSYGKLIVAQVGDRVVGMAKLTQLSADQWWLEGLRVKREHQRQGVAGKLQAHLVEEFTQTGRGSLRFGTHSQNHPIHRLASRDGFRHVATYRLYEAEPLPPEHALPLHQLAESDLDPTWRLILGSPRYRAASGLYETFWSWQELTRERLAYHVSRGEVWSIDLDAHVASLALICQTDKEDAIDIGYADGREGTMETLLVALRGLAAQRGCDKVRLRAVDEPKLITAVERAGYQSSWDRDLWIFQLSAGHVSS